MERHLHLDPVSGASGDMFLGLLLNLGWSADSLASVPERLGLCGVEVRVSETHRGALAAGRVEVLIGGRPAESHTGADRAARTLGKMLSIVDRARLCDRSALRARGAIERLFAAEAVVHGEEPSKIHLHEAGGDDALVDIVGTAIGLEELGVGTVSCSEPIPVGGGRIRCAHGELPVPAPAVVELLAGIPVCGGPVDRELVTPTGAAILRAVVDEFGHSPSLTIEKGGFGAGAADDPRQPNVLRGMLGLPASAPSERTLVVLECAVDDMLPQDLPVLIESLIDRGARDAFLRPVIMKKGRPGHLITVLADPGEETRLANMLLHESSTLGVRMRREKRLEWDRDVIRVDTPFGSVRLKRALDGAGRVIRSQPEFEDCRRAANRSGATIDEVRNSARTGRSEEGGKGD